MLEFLNPLVLLLLPLPLLVQRFAPAMRSAEDVLRVPFFPRLQRLNEKLALPASTSTRKPWWELLWLYLCWACVLIALAEPIWLGDPVERRRSARDVLVAVDLSQSMQTQDFRSADGQALTRLAAVKSVLQSFVSAREHDRLGLILFGDGAYLQAPFTEDHHAWLTLLNEAQIGMAGQSTRFGDAIGLAIRIFSQSRNDNRVLLVLTDGNDTGSMVPPVEAARIAAHEGIRIYTIAVGDPETSGEQALDVETLQRIAELTEGAYYQALDNQRLITVSQQIAAMEPELFETLNYRPRQQLLQWPVMLLALLLSLPVLRRFVSVVFAHQKVRGQNG